MNGFDLAIIPMTPIGLSLLAVALLAAAIFLFLIWEDPNARTSIHGSVEGHAGRGNRDSPAVPRYLAAGAEMTFGRKLLAVPLVLLSVVLNGISGLVWSFNGKPDDEGHWEAGMRQGFGIFGPEVDNQIGNVLSEPWKRKDHFIKKITHVWLQAHTKRANKVYSLVILSLAVAVVVLAWRPWGYFTG